MDDFIEIFTQIYNEYVGDVDLVEDTPITKIERDRLQDFKLYVESSTLIVIDLSS